MVRVILGYIKRAVSQMIQLLLGEPEGIRTPDRLLRRQMLYPAELPVRPFVAANLRKIS